MAQAIEKYGPFVGVKMGVNRLIRCRIPNGGVDNP
jgi:putative component of membrane protein insertase Oxa1/YidC/SpoIIIJ protein YidD